MIVDPITTLEAWRTRLDQSRSASPPPQPADRDRLRNSFRELSRRIRRVSSSIWTGPLAPDGCLPALSQALSLSALLVREIERADPAAEADLIELLQAISTLLLELEAQGALADRLLAIVQELQGIAEGCGRGEEPSARQLLHLAEELILGHAAADLPLIPMSAKLFSHGFRDSGIRGGGSMALSALTATWAARHTARVGLDHPDRMTAVIAALLMQDAGELLADRYRKRSDPGTGSRRSDPNHPAVAAAILGQFPECSSRIPILVGGHHERLDGTGFPQRLAGRKLSPELRWITLLVRLGELILDPLTDEMTTGGQGCDRAQVAGVRLWREVRRGAFEERQARLLLDGLRPGLADQIEELFPRFQKRIVDPRHLVPAPAGTWSREAAAGMAGRGEFMEAAHEIAAPAYLRRRRVIDPRAAKGAAAHRSGSPSG